jgi:hypothetical protein
MEATLLTETQKSDDEEMERRGKVPTDKVR